MFVNLSGASDDHWCQTQLLTAKELQLITALRCTSWSFPPPSGAPADHFHFPQVHQLIISTILRCTSWSFPPTSGAPAVHSQRSQVQKRCISTACTCSVVHSHGPQVHQLIIPIALRCTSRSFPHSAGAPADHSQTPSGAPVDYSHLSQVHQLIISTSLRCTSWSFPPQRRPARNSSSNVASTTTFRCCLSDLLGLAKLPTLRPTLEA